jgi:hypothetical protein
MIEIAGIGGFILLVLNIWAIVSIVNSGASTGGKVIWILLVLIMPILGFIVWLLFGPRSRRQRL